MKSLSAFGLKVKFTNIPGETPCTAIGVCGVGVGVGDGVPVGVGVGDGVGPGVGVGTGEAETGMRLAPVE